jgi:triosephosphate isomerase
MRTPFIAGNWKMHLDRRAVGELCTGLAALTDDDLDAGGEGPVKVGVFPPFVYLPQVVEALAGRDIVVGAQTGRPEDEGAFTGEVSMRQVKDVGAGAVLVGHSERRHVLGETDADVRARLDAALAHDLHVVLCLGETLEQRRAGRTAEVVLSQLEAGTEGLDGASLAKDLTLAYEPVWAIGTGEVASPEQAQEVHGLLRGRVAEAFGESAAEALVIQYGGSVKPANVAELMACPDVDGALVGGASLQLQSFRGILRLGR